MASIKTFIRACKHPDTPEVIWRNVFGFDIVRSRVKGRCEYCDATISEDPKNVQEVFDRRMQKTIQVCDLCASIHRSLYANYKLKNMNYFKAIDEAEDKENEERKRRMK